MSFTRNVTLLFALLGAIVTSLPAQAGWHDQPNGMPVCPAAGNQYLPVIISDGEGGAIVTWSDDRGGGGTDIYAQRFNALGVNLWARDGVVLCTAVGNQRYCTVVADGMGGAIVTWMDARNGNAAIWAQRVSAAGVPQWPADGVVVCSHSSDAYSPIPVADGHGGAIVAWGDTRGYEDGTETDVYAQHIDSDGHAGWAMNGVAICRATGAQHWIEPWRYHGMVSDSAGGAIIAWADGRSSPTLIYAQRIDATGTIRWPVNGVAMSPELAVDFALVADGAGGAFAALIGEGIKVQRIDAAGVPLWVAGGVSASSERSLWAGSPVVVTDGAGGAIVNWLDALGTNWWRQVYSQRIGPTGTLLWPASAVTTAGTETSDFLAATADGAGGVITAWVSPAGYPHDLATQRIDALGSTWWPSGGLALCAAPGEQAWPQLTPDGTGGAFAVWEDMRSGTGTSVYTQRIELNPVDDIAPTVRLLVPNGGETAGLGGIMTIRWEASDNVKVEAVDIELSRSGAGGPWEYLARDLPNTGSHAWSVTGDESNFDAFVRVSARDAAGGEGSDVSDAAFAISALPVPTLVDLFRLEDRLDGVAIHWSVADHSGIASLSPQRGASETGEWTEVAGTPEANGASYTLVDREATLFAQRWYRLAGIGSDGRAISVPPLSIVHEAVTAFALDRLAPNPVSTTAQVSYALPQASHVRMSLVDVQGREVSVLADAELAAGRHVARLDVSDLRAGLYFLRMRVHDKELKQRLIVVR